MPDFICTICGAGINHQVDGMRVKPEQCQNCESPKSDIIETSIYEQNEQINAEDKIKEAYTHREH